MIEMLKNVLSKANGVSDWLINLTETRSSELFYVGKELETNRSSNVKNCTVTVYSDIEKDGGKFRGSSVFSVYDYMSEQDLMDKVKENVYAAGFALNPWFEIAQKEEREIAGSTSNLKDMSLKEAAEVVSDAVFKADHFENGYLSATEIFINQIKKTVVNSQGVCLSSVSYNGMVELIPSWREDELDVEIYHMLRFETLDAAEITALVEEKLNLVHARCEAKKLSDVMDMDKECKVILQDNEVGSMFRYYTADLSYAAKYSQANRFEMGDAMQGKDPKGTVLNLSMKSMVSGCFRSAAFDDDGVILKDMQLVKDGIAVGRFGDQQMGYYVGEKHPSGALPITVVEAGDKSFEEMAKEPYVRCVVFSGLQVERNSGYFGGEVRLGFYFDGEKEIPVTGFSISGNFKEAGASMIYSSESQKGPAFMGPKYLEIFGMKFA